MVHPTCPATSPAFHRTRHHLDRELVPVECMVPVEGVVVAKGLANVDVKLDSGRLFSCTFGRRVKGDSSVLSLLVQDRLGYPSTNSPSLDTT